MAGVPLGRSPLQQWGGNSALSPHQGPEGLFSEWSGSTIIKLFIPELALSLYHEHIHLTEDCQSMFQNANVITSSLF